MNQSPKVQNMVADYNKQQDIYSLVKSRRQHTTVAPSSSTASAIAGSTPYPSHRPGASLALKLKTTARPLPPSSPDTMDIHMTDDGDDTFTTDKKAQHKKSASSPRKFPSIRTTPSPVFKKSSPHYKIFIELCKKKGWEQTLPRTQDDADLEQFLIVTGYTRAQVTRKFNEYAKFVWYERSGMKTERQRLVEVAKLTGTIHALPPPISLKKLIPKPRKNNPSLMTGGIVKKKKTSIKKQKKSPKNQKPSNKQKGLSACLQTTPTVVPTVAPHVAILPAPPLRHCSSLGDWPLSDISYNSDTNQGMPPLPTTPVRRHCSTFSEKSPLRTRQVFEVHSTPVVQTTTVTLNRHPSLALYPPSLTRIQTKEMEMMLKGRLLSCPSGPSAPSLQVTEFTSEKQQLGPFNATMQQQAMRMVNMNMVRNMNMNMAEASLAHQQFRPPMTSLPLMQGYLGASGYCSGDNNVLESFTHESSMANSFAMFGDQTSVQASNSLSQPRPKRDSVVDSARLAADTATDQSSSGGCAK